jgi:hypothetical protein
MTRPLGRPRCILQNSIKMDLKEIGLKCVDWIYMARREISGGGLL